MWYDNATSTISTWRICTVSTEMNSVPKNISGLNVSRSENLLENYNCKLEFQLCVIKDYFTRVVFY